MPRPLTDNGKDEFSGVRAASPAGAGPGAGALVVPASSQLPYPMAPGLPRAEIPAPERKEGHGTGVHEGSGCATAGGTRRVTRPTSGSPAVHVTTVLGRKLADRARRPEEVTGDDLRRPPHIASRFSRKRASPGAAARTRVCWRDDCRSDAPIIRTLDKPLTNADPRCEVTRRRHLETNEVLLVPSGSLTIRYDDEAILGSGQLYVVPRGCNTSRSQSGARTSSSSNQARPSTPETPQPPHGRAAPRLTST